MVFVSTGFSDATEQQIVTTVLMNENVVVQRVSLYSLCTRWAQNLCHLADKRQSFVWWVSG
jgi:hypothetical protein